MIAEASLIGGIFGKGGGSEVRSALARCRRFEQALRQEGRAQRLERTSARKNDPEAPTTVSASASPTRRRAPFAKRGLAMPDPGSVQLPTPVAPSRRARVAAAPRRSSGAYDSDVGAQLAQALHAAAARLQLGAGLAREHSTTGHPIGVLGPAGRLLRTRRS